ncbi:MAG: VirB8/TrbF family protein [Pseudomonadota bacterium]
MILKKKANADPRHADTEIIDGRRKGESDNPYLSARRTWNEHVRGVVSSRQSWQFIGLLSMLITLASIGGIIHIGSQSKFIPYVVQVDKLGEAVAAGPVTATTSVDPRILSTTVSEFISSARVVTPDVALQRKAILKLYALLSASDPATEKMNEWLNGNSPFKRAENEMVSIEIKSVLAQTTNTWQVDWMETLRDRQGVIKETKNMRALITVYTTENSPETTEEQIRLNPLSIYIRDFSWSGLQ